MADFKLRGKIEKVDAELGIVFGWAIICKENGVDYFDTQGDHIPEDAMLEAAMDFVENSAVMKEMHDGEEKGYTIFVWPMTSEIAKAFGITLEKTGLMIGAKPKDKDMLKRFQLGELTGFSIGGQRVVDEEVQDD